jgi:hypothetical protein
MTSKYAHLLHFSRVVVVSFAELRLGGRVSARGVSLNEGRSKAFLIWNEG